MVLMGTGDAASGTPATIPGPWPGLPDQVIPDGYYFNTQVGTQGNGLTEVSRARQWVKIPNQAVATEDMAGPDIFYGSDDPLGREFVKHLFASVFLSSPKGAKYGYGVGLPVTVRTVAFGAVPVQVKLQLEQLRDDDDLPVPLTATNIETHYVRPQQVRPDFSSAVSGDVEMTGQVQVRLTSLAVDGLDVGLRDCVTPPIDLHLHDTTFWIGDPLHDPGMHSSDLVANADPVPPVFAPGSTEGANWMAAQGEATFTFGGVVSGKIDIPALSHCLSSTGEDLSPLLTAAVSGPGNPVTVGMGSVARIPATNQPPCGTVKPPLRVAGPRGPFLGDPSDCDRDYGPPTLAYPARPAER